MPTYSLYWGRFWVPPYPNFSLDFVLSNCFQNRSNVLGILHCVFWFIVDCLCMDCICPSVAIILLLQCSKHLQLDSSTCGNPVANHWYSRMRVQCPMMRGCMVCIIFQFLFAFLSPYYEYMCIDKIVQYSNFDETVLITLFLFFSAVL